MLDRRNTKAPMNPQGRNGAAFVRDDPATCTPVTGASGDTVISASPVELLEVRVGGAADLTGAVGVKTGSTTIETLAALAKLGDSRKYYGSILEGGLKINLAQAADTVLVFWRLA